MPSWLRQFETFQNFYPMELAPDELAKFTTPSNEIYRKAPKIPSALRRADPYGELL